MHTRRQVLAGLGAIGAQCLASTAHAFDPLGWFGAKIERGARLRVLRWKPYVDAEEAMFLANSQRFAEKTGVEVRVESDVTENLLLRARKTADNQVGADIIFETADNVHSFPEKLLDLTALAEDLGRKYGGWHPTMRVYGMHHDRWVALPHGALPYCLTYRISHIRAAGFEKMPTNLGDFLTLCQRLAQNGTPAGFPLGRSANDAASWTHWCLWAHGGKVANANNEVVLYSPETIAALEYAKQLFQTFRPETLSWVDSSNNLAFLAGECSLTANPVSIYATALRANDPQRRAMAADIDHAAFPIGPVGQSTESGSMSLALVFRHTPYPNAAREYLRWMMEKEQYDPWLAASKGYLSPPLAYYEKNPVWTSDPKVTPFRDFTRRMLPIGHAGSLGKAASAVLGQLIVVDMFADVCGNKKTPQEAASHAAAHARKYYSA
ncbi:ABC transporter substrate-binding protein [Candidatus Symbiobacter mobilis]|uniref:ABC transporter substrate-binding protein n=1 Tax=Candidatus Symbiobacter mobilis TaxID=1436290 RepID=UPI001EE684D4|nr:extracellular solute-binding protein [Candidatus Symbiobacter mobilis]